MCTHVSVLTSVLRKRLPGKVCETPPAIMNSSACDNTLEQASSVLCTVHMCNTYGKNCEKYMHSRFAIIPWQFRHKSTTTASTEACGVSMPVAEVEAVEACTDRGLSVG